MSRGGRGEPRTLHDEPGRSAWTDRDPRATVPWFPRYLLLELVALLALFVVLAVISLAIDAPLLAIADPDRTPDPSKAPWYFVGLQELLHYYPPVVAAAGVPVAVLTALVTLPYLRPGGGPLWTPETRRGPLAGRLGLALAVALVAMVVPAADVPWVLIVPTVAIAAASTAPGLREASARGPLLRWLGRRTLRGWLFAWVALTAVVLSLVGALFRGPGWRWVWPWIEGIY